MKTHRKNKGTFSKTSGWSIMLLVFQMVAGLSICMAQPVTFFSTQFYPVKETQTMRNKILRECPIPVDFCACDDRIVFEKLAIEAVDAKGGPVLLGGLHGDFAMLYHTKALSKLNTLQQRLTSCDLFASYVDMARLDGQNQYYVPWAQASYLMIANVKALKFLPENVSLNRLTYQQLISWAKAMHGSQNEAKMGFPAGATGLFHRFLQGYLYPSYTRSTVTGFRSDQAIKMWMEVKELWKYVHPDSLTYSSMSVPLLSEKIWVAWDHSARLVNAVLEKPDQFVVFPAPVGPEGRGFMVVLLGLGIPRDCPDKKRVENIIAYLTHPKTQNVTFRETGFFPVSEKANTKNLPAGLVQLNLAVQKQTTDPGAVPALLPAGLSTRNKEFDSIYLLAFSQIVLRNSTIRTVLDQQAEKLRKVMQEADAPCWKPDKSGIRPCPVE